MKHYPFMWGFFHKPWHKDPVLNNQYFTESIRGVFFRGSGVGLLFIFFWEQKNHQKNHQKSEIGFGVWNVISNENIPWNFNTSNAAIQILDETMVKRGHGNESTPDVQPAYSNMDDLCGCTNHPRNVRLVWRSNF